MLQQANAAQAPKEDPGVRESKDLPIIEEGAENHDGTMKGSKVISPPIEEQISADSQEDKYSDEEYEVIEEAEEL